MGIIPIDVVLRCVAVIGSEEWNYEALENPDISLGSLGLPFSITRLVVLTSIMKFKLLMYSTLLAYVACRGIDSARDNSFETVAFPRDR